MNPRACKPRPDGPRGAGLTIKKKEKEKMKLTEAIDRSRQFSEIVTAQYDGTMQEALAALAEIWPGKP